MHVYFSFLMFTASHHGCTNKQPYKPTWLCCFEGSFKSHAKPVWLFHLHASQSMAMSVFASHHGFLVSSFMLIISMEAIAMAVKFDLSSHRLASI